MLFSLFNWALVVVFIPWLLQFWLVSIWSLLKACLLFLSSTTIYYFSSFNPLLHGGIFSFFFRFIIWLLSVEISYDDGIVPFDLFSFELLLAEPNTACLKLLKAIRTTVTLSSVLRRSEFLSIYSTATPLCLWIF